MNRAKPSEALVCAWREYLRTMAKAKVARVKSEMMFKHAANDVELYNRANALALQARRLGSHADVKFRQAIHAEWGKRYRIVWTDDTTCTVYARERYSKDEQRLTFNKSLRSKNSLH